MREIYLDTAATTKPDPQVLIDFVKYSEMFPYNPSSIYKGGVDARNALESARKRLAKCIGCQYDEIFFTSGGTEGNNMILRGFFKCLKKGQRGVLITSQIEHPSILRVAEDLEQNQSNVTVYYIPVDSSGLIDENTLLNTIIMEIKEGIRPENILVSIQTVNSEIGTRQDMDYIYRVCKENCTFLHTDTVQYFPHYLINLEYFHVNSFSVSGHKFGALRGTGFIYINKAMQEHLSPIMLGGHQELGFRAGTENVAGILAMVDHIERHYQLGHSMMGDEVIDDHILFNYLFDSNIEFKILTNIFAEFGTNIYSLCFPGVDAQALISLLSEDGIYLSAGSACHSYETTPSHVLKAIGLSDEDAKSTVRICIPPNFSDDDYKFFCEQLVYYIKLLKG